MKAVIAIDSFKGSMDSIEAGEAAEKGIRRVFTDAETIVYPLADGGEGTVQALAKGLGGKLEKVKVTGPLGEPVICEYGIVEEKTAIIEMAGAAGITLVQPKLRNPLNTTTYGVGEVIKDAIGKGCRHFIIGIGGSATNDGGIGMLQALGAEFLDEGGKQVPFGAKGVEKLAAINCEHILFELKDCDFRIACDVDNPLCGENGCSHIFGPQKGASPQQVQILDAALSHYAQVLQNQLCSDAASRNGSGAAGGLGCGLLAFFHTDIRPGIDLVLDLAHFDQAAAQADLVITGEGRFDSQSIRGKVVSGVSKRAKARQVPVLVIAGSVAEEVEPISADPASGIAAVFSINRQAMDYSESRPFSRRNYQYTLENLLRLIKGAALMKD